MFANVVPCAGDDIVDEAIAFFRANVLFKSFEPKGGADLLLIYLTLFCHKVITECARKSNKKAGASGCSLPCERSGVHNSAACVYADTRFRCTRQLKHTSSPSAQQILPSLGLPGGYLAACTRSRPVTRKAVRSFVVSLCV